MKIKKVEFWTEHIKLTRPYTIAYKTTYDVENIFVKLIADKGVYGIGVASPAKSITGESFDSCRAALEEHLSALVLNKEVSLNLIWEIQKALPNNPGACAAIDIALYDLWAKQAKQPLVTLFGQVHQSLPTSITIGIKETIAEAVAEAKEYKERRFKMIKLKVGLDVAQDIEIVHRIKETIGKDMLIRVDANQGYTTETLLQFLKATDSLNLEFVEQPFHPSAIEETMALPLHIRKKIAADENLHKPADALKYANHPQAFGIYNIKLMKCGGIGASLAIAQIAYYAGIDLMWGCMDESCVSIAAALHAALANPNTKYLDLDGSLDLERDPFKGGFILEDGFMSINGQPGLGVLEDG